MVGVYSPYLAKYCLVAQTSRFDGCCAFKERTAWRDTACTARQRFIISRSRITATKLSVVTQALKVALKGLIKCIGISK